MEGGESGGEGGQYFLTACVDFTYRLLSRKNDEFRFAIA